MVSSSCRWHGELEAARTSETEEKYRRYAATLDAHLAGCQQILDKVRIPCMWQMSWPAAVLLPDL